MSIRYEYQHLVDDILEQTDQIIEFSQYLSTLLAKIKQKNSPYNKIDIVTKDIEELKKRYNKCFRCYDELLYKNK